MRHGVLYYFVADAITDLRAWLRAKWGKAIIILRQHLWSLYADGGQSIAIIEADARAAIRRGKY